MSDDFDIDDIINKAISTIKKEIDLLAMKKELDNSEATKLNEYTKTLISLRKDSNKDDTGINKALADFKAEHLDAIINNKPIK
jgi:hypothetical protein